MPSLKPVNFNNFLSVNNTLEEGLLEHDGVTTLHWIPQYNRPLPSSKNPHFQNEAKCTTFLVEMCFICTRMKNHFHNKGWALNFVLIQRPRGNSEVAYCITTQQIDNRKFIHLSTTIVSDINYRATREKSTQPTAHRRSSMTTIIFALKHRLTVK